MALGRKTGGGSRKGKPNKGTAAKVKAIEASGQTPLDFMLQQMRDKTLDLPMRHDMARAAAPYVHPRLAQIDQTGALTVNVIIKTL